MANQHGDAGISTKTSIAPLCRPLEGELSAIQLTYIMMAAEHQRWG